MPGWFKSLTVLVMLTACTPVDPAVETTANRPQHTATREVITGSPAPSASPSKMTRTPQADTPTRSAGAADADVEFVRAVMADDGTWTFHVRVSHPDTGWEDYADGWDVVTPEGEVLKPDPDSPFTRLLLHPHENEQPFTRSQAGIRIPEGVSQVTVRAHDLIDGFGGQEVIVHLNESEGDGFTVER